MSCPTAGISAMFEQALASTPVDNTLLTKAVVAWEAFDAKFRSRPTTLLGQYKTAPILTYAICSSALGCRGDPSRVSDWTVCFEETLPSGALQ